MSNKPTSLLQLQDRLTGCLIGLVKAADANGETPPSVDRCILDALCSLSKPKEKEAHLVGLITRITMEKQRLAPDCFACTSPCGRTSDYDMNGLWNAEPQIRRLKTLLLYGIRQMASHARRLSDKYPEDREITAFFHKVLFLIGIDTVEESRLLSLISELDEVNMKCLSLLKEAENPPQKP